MSDKPAVTTKATDSTSTRTPYGPAAGYFPELYSTGQNALMQNQQLPVPSQFVAGPTAGQRSGVQQMYDVAPSTGGPAASLEEMAQKVASGFFLDPRNDPTFAGAASAAIDPITRNLTNTILPGITSGAIRMGGGGGGPTAYGGAALGLPTEKALQDWDTQAGNITASMANASRNMGMNLIPQAAGIASGAAGVGLLPAQVTEAAGGIEQGLNQTSINDLLQRYQAMLSAPWQGIGNMSSLLTAGGYGTTTGTGTETTTGPPPNMATQWLQGLTGGSSALASLFGSKGAFPGAVGGATNWLQSLMQAAPEVAAVV